MSEIIGYGGGGKGGSGSGGSGASEASDTLRSSEMAFLLDALCEGPINGLVNGAQSVYLDQTPLQNADGNWNFDNATFAYSVGDIAGNQLGIGSLSGDSGNIESTVSVATKVYQATPIVKTVTDANVDYIRVTVYVPQLTHTDSKTGDISGSSVHYKIDLNINGGG